MKKNKRLVGYATLKEACMVARNNLLEHKSHYFESVYVEKDGSYTVGEQHTKNSQFVVAVDKSGTRYIKKWVKENGYKHEKYVPVK